MTNRYSVNLEFPYATQRLFIAGGIATVVGWSITYVLTKQLKALPNWVPISIWFSIATGITLAVLVCLVLYQRHVRKFLATMSRDWTEKRIKEEKLIGNPHYIIQSFRNAFELLNSRTSQQYIMLAICGFIISVIGIGMFVAVRHNSPRPPDTGDYANLLIPMAEFVLVILAAIVSSLFTRKALDRSESDVVGHIERIFRTNAVEQLQDVNAQTAEDLADTYERKIIDTVESGRPHSNDSQYGDIDFGDNAFDDSGGKDRAFDFGVDDFKAGGGFDSDQNWGSAGFAGGDGASVSEDADKW